MFVETTLLSGMGEASRPHVGWGTGFADIDNDGWKDVFMANGHLYPDIG